MKGFLAWPTPTPHHHPHSPIAVEMIPGWVNTSLTKSKSNWKKNLTDNSIILHSWQLLFQTIKIENYERGPACVCRTHTNTQKDIYIISPNHPCYTFFLGKCCLEICIPFVCFFFLFVCLFVFNFSKIWKFWSNGKCPYICFLAGLGMVSYF